MTLLLSVRMHKTKTVVFSELPHWVKTAGLDEEMKRRLEITDQKAVRHPQGA